MWCKLLAKRRSAKLLHSLWGVLLVAALLEGGIGLATPPSPQPKTSFPQPTPPTMLRLLFKKGQVFTYRVDIQFTLRQPSQKLPLYSLREALIERAQVEDVLPNGNARITLEVLSGEGILNGKGFTVQASEAPLQITVAPNGKVVSMSASQSSSPMASFLQKATDLYGLLFPSYPVALGAHWSYSEEGGRTTVGLVGPRQVGPYSTLLLRSLSTLSLHTLAPFGTGDALLLRGPLRLRSETDYAPREGVCVRIVKRGWADLQVRTLQRTKGGQSTTDSKNTGKGGGASLLVVSAPVRMIAMLHVTAGIVE